MSADLADSGAAVHLIDRPGNLLRQLSIEEAAELHTDLGVLLSEHRKRTPPRSYAMSAPKCVGRRGAPCTNRALPGTNRCAVCEV